MIIYMNKNQQLHQRKNKLGPIHNLKNLMKSSGIMRPSSKLKEKTQILTLSQLTVTEILSTEATGNQPTLFQTNDSATEFEF